MVSKALLKRSVLTSQCTFFLPSSNIKFCQLVISAAQLPPVARFTPTSLFVSSWLKTALIPITLFAFMFRNCHQQSLETPSQCLHNAMFPSQQSCGRGLKSTMWIKASHQTTSISCLQTTSLSLSVGLPPTLTTTSPIWPFFLVLTQTGLLCCSNTLH